MQAVQLCLEWASNWCALHRRGRHVYWQAPVAATFNRSSLLSGFLAVPCRRDEERWQGKQVGGTGCGAGSADKDSCKGHGSCPSAPGSQSAAHQELISRVHRVAMHKAQWREAYPGSADDWHHAMMLHDSGGSPHQPNRAAFGHSPPT